MMQLLWFIAISVVVLIALPTLVGLVMFFWVMIHDD